MLAPGRGFVSLADLHAFDYPPPIAVEDDLRGRRALYRLAI